MLCVFLIPLWVSGLYLDWFQSELLLVFLDCLHIRHQFVIEAHLLFHLPAFVCSVPFSVDHNTFKADDSKCEKYNINLLRYIYCVSAHITGYRCLFYKQIYMCTTYSLFLTSDFLVENSCSFDLSY